MNQAARSARCGHGRIGNLNLRIGDPRFIGRSKNAGDRFLDRQAQRVGGVRAAGDWQRREDDQCGDAESACS